MLNFDITFFKEYIYAKGWPDINLGASHESCAHPSLYVQQKILTEKKTNFIDPRCLYV